MRVEVDPPREDEVIMEPRSPKLDDDVLEVIERRDAVEGVREPEPDERGPRPPDLDLVGMRAEAIALGSTIMFEAEAREVRGEE